MRTDNPLVRVPLRLEHVTVVDTNSGHGALDMTVNVENGIITDVAPTGTVGDRRDVASVDASGKYVVPGFNDMHVHALQRPDTPGAFAPMLANGVMGMRQMAGSADLLDRRRRGVLGIGPHAPELLAMPGAILTATNAGTPEAAASTVAEQRAAGADFIKLILVPPAALFGALEAATSAGMLVAGHLQDGPIRSPSPTRAFAASSTSVRGTRSGPPALVRRLQSRRRWRSGRRPRLPSERALITPCWRSSPSIRWRASGPPSALPAAARHPVPAE